SAVAWSASKLGSASRELLVRDPVALTASTARFLTLGDDARLELALHNIEGPAGAYELTGQYESEPGADAQPSFERTPRLAAGKRKRQAFRLKPREVGLRTLSLRDRGPNGTDVRRRLTFDVKVPAGDIKRLTVSSLPARGGKVTLTRDLLHDLIARKSKVSVS